jgi:Tfp pilus assembly protein PilF
MLQSLLLRLLPKASLFPPALPKKYSIRIPKRLHGQKHRLVALSITVLACGCQTLSNSSSEHSKAEAATTLDVARAFLDEGRPDKAMFELRAIIEQNRNNPMVHSLMGLSQLALKNPRKAIESLEIAWKLDPIAQHALNLSSAYIDSKQYDRAQKMILAGLAVKETPTYKNKERFYHNLGVIAELKGARGAAEKAYLRALEENPVFYISRIKVATMMDGKQKPEAAKMHWELARTSCSGCFEPVAHLAIYYHNKGESAKAVKMIEDFARIEGLNPAESKKAAALKTVLSNSPSKIAELPKTDSAH